MMVNKKIQIEIVYASTKQQRLLKLEVDANATIGEAIHSSGILNQFTDIDLTKQKVGIFGKLKQLSDKVTDGDRIEIYRPLIMDPKEARRHRSMVRK